MRIGTSWLAAAVVCAAGCGTPGSGPEPTDDASAPAVRVARTVATGLDVPWGVAFLPDGSALVSERDTRRIVHIGQGGADTVDTVDTVETVDTVDTVDTVEEAVPAGEGGLLGIAYAEGRLYAYLTAAEDNRVVRMDWSDGSRRVGSPRPVLTGIPKAVIHNGGRIVFGPDDMLYIATGDAGTPAAAQDPDSLAGKILRVTPEGGVPGDNPKAGSPVFSLGHRNVQGLAFDARGRLWASEFGQSDVDELNLITPGGNYGWPECEGACTRSGYVDPVVQWSPTSIASPSGIAVAGDYAYIASLRGQTLWQVPLDGSGEAARLDLGDLGRLRTVATAPDGSLWLSTSNTDGRGDPRPGDDRILGLAVAPSG